MKTLILLAAFAVATAGWAQEQKKEEAKPAAQESAKPAAPQESAKPAPLAKKKPSPRRFQDARHCLEKASNTEIIKCAEAYL
jgi:hypothetical protein